MTEELYINEQRVDMKTDTKITLNFKSNLLGDISKITSSNSQTISLPKTNHNRNIFDDPTSPPHSSSFARRKHAARYVKNGVTVIADAYAVLLDCSDKYEIALYWGEMTKFQEWVNSGAKLNDLSGLSSIYRIWNRNNTKPDSCWRLSDGRITCPLYEDFLFYALYDTGVGSWYTMNNTAKSVVAPFPFMSARKLLSLIQSDAGITFDLPTTFTQANYGLLRRVGVHLSTRKTSTPELKSGTVRGVGGQKKGESYYQGGLLVTMPASAAYSTEDKEFEVNIFGDKSTATHLKFNVDGRVRVYGYFAIGVSVGKWEHDIHSEYSIGFVTASVYKNGNQTNVIPIKNSRDTYVGKSGTRYIYECYVSLSGEIDVVKGDELAVNFQVDGKFYTFGNWSTPIWSGSTFQITPPAVEINTSLGENFRTKGNLPDIKQLDFVKAIAAMFGLYVIPSGVSNKLKFVSLDMLLNNTSNAVDWSSKLVSNGDGDPSKIKFAWGDYCRRNKFVYKSSDDVTASGDGEILIGNESLDAEKEVIKLPFTASDEVIANTDNGEVAVIIPHLETETDGQIKDVKVDPRVVMIMPDDAEEGDAVARFTPISFNQLLDTYYQTMRRLLNDAVVITEKFRLNEFDLLTLDFTKPVYLRQYGKYYGVVSVQASGNECTVELVQLPSARAGVSGGVFYSTDGGATYAATLPDDPVNLKVYTILTSIGNDDVRTLSEIETLKNLDLSDAEFNDPDTGATIGDADGETVLFDDNVEHITFPRNVSAIGDECCQGLAKIRTVTLPPSVQSIGYEAFDSSLLRAIDIPASLTELKQYAFWSCRRLHTLVCRATSVPDTASAVFRNLGAYIIGDKSVYVPAVAPYENDDVWGALADAGFAFRLLSEYIPATEIKVTGNVSAETITATASKAVSSNVTVTVRITRDAATLTRTITIPSGSTTKTVSVDFDSFVVVNVTPTRDSVSRFCVLTN